MLARQIKVSEANQTGLFWGRAIFMGKHSPKRPTSSAANFQATGASVRRRMHLRILASPRFRRGKTSGPSLWILLALVLLGVLLARGFFNSGDSASAMIGDRMPKLKVSGWLNTDQPPTNQSLMGKVVLIDCWATWCGPCRKKMPALIKLRDRFSDQGVVVLGLTPEDNAELAAVRDYLNKVPQLNWPIGYGADPMFAKLDVREIPTLIVLDRHGTIVSKGHDLEEAENALIETLSQG